MYSAYKLNKQGDNIQPQCTPFPIWNQSVGPCPVLAVPSWPAYRFLKRWVRWSGIPISFRIFQFIVIHTVKGFGIVNKAERDVFLELSCFFDNPVDVGNLISGSSVFSKTSLNIWKFMLHILLKPGLENFEHYFTSQTAYMIAKDFKNKCPSKQNRNHSAFYDQPQKSHSITSTVPVGWCYNKTPLSFKDRGLESISWWRSGQVLKEHVSWKLLLQASLETVTSNLASHWPSTLTQFPIMC